MEEQRKRDMEEQRMEEAEEGGNNSGSVMLSDEPTIEGREGYLGMFRGVLNV